MKYMGSKERIGKYIANIITSIVKSDIYIEPFVGGANMINKIDIRRRIGYDINKFVIALLCALRDGWMPSRIDKATYSDIKSNPQNYPDFMVGFAGICCSYSGKWFGGFADKVVTQIGTIRDYQKEAIENILKQAPSLKKIEFIESDYRTIAIPNNSIVYCDPPYKSTTTYKDNFDHNIFWKWAEEIAKHSFVFVSEYNAPINWTCLWEKRIGSSLSANGIVGGRKESTEKLFTLNIKNLKKGGGE